MALLGGAHHRRGTGGLLLSVVREEVKGYSLSLLLEVNEQTCNQDGICAAVCPVGIIRFQKGGYPAPVSKADEFCIRCGHCVAVCPTGSLAHRELPAGAFVPVREDLRLSPEHCEHFLRSRRSIRNYMDRQVPRHEIMRLIDLARYAPSGHNSQCAEWLVVDDREEVRRLAGLVADWMRWMIGHKPELARGLHLEATVKRWERGDDIILRGAPVLIVAHAARDNRMAPSTCTIALTCLELAATSMGLGGCWAGYFTAAAETFPPLREALALPEGHHTFGSMMVGYPKFSYHRLPPRNPPKVTWR
jgi:nitroreductase/NAD-dependent dihydropyrimidine dehydrogenase PreA subunit